MPVPIVVAHASSWRAGRPALLDEGRRAAHRHGARLSRRRDDIDGRHPARRPTGRRQHTHPPGQTWSRCRGSQCRPRARPDLRRNRAAGCRGTAPGRPAARARRPPASRNPCRHAGAAAAAGGVARRSNATAAPSRAVSSWGGACPLRRGRRGACAHAWRQGEAGQDRAGQAVRAVHASHPVQRYPPFPLPPLDHASRTSGQPC